MKEPIQQRLLKLRTELQQDYRNRDFEPCDPSGAKLELVLKALELAICVAPIDK